VQRREPSLQRFVKELDSKNLSGLLFLPLSVAVYPEASQGSAEALSLCELGRPPVLGTRAPCQGAMSGHDTVHDLQHNPLIESTRPAVLQELKGARMLP